MLIAKPKNLFSRSYMVTDLDGAVVAELVVAFLKEGAQLHHDGKLYRIEREGLFSGPWRLVHQGEVVYEARKPSLIRNRFMTTVKGADLELSPTSLMLRKFQVVGPDWVELGTIERPSWFSRRVRIDLSELVPVLAQLFLLFLANVLWHRADNSSGT